jgi:LysR family hydrogen peroxide-inducible transcriptional activator
MNLRDIEYILAVAEHKSFSAAAIFCNVSQPSLSTQVKKVEDELGARIFERDNRHVYLTAFGQVFIERAARIGQEVESIKSAAKQSLNPFDGTFTLGAIATVAPYYFPEVLKKIRKKAPLLQLNLHEGQTATLVEDLLGGRIDAAILSLPPDQHLFESAPLFDDRFFLAVPEGHRLSKKKHVAEEDFRDEKLILLDDGHCLRQQALDLCQRATLHEDRAFRATSLETIRHIVATGDGLTLMPALAVRKGDGVAYVPLKNPHYSRSIGLVWRKSTGRTELMSALVKLLAR